MALDIGVGDQGSYLPDPNEDQVHLEEEHFALLQPWLEQLRIKTGQMIDEFGDARFSDDQLTNLTEMIRAIHREIAQYPVQWEQLTGYAKVQGERELVERRRTIVKSQLLNMLATWDQIIERARETGRSVVCFGD
jgi:hypothetical protein